MNAPPVRRQDDDTAGSTWIYLGRTVAAHRWGIAIFTVILMIAAVLVSLISQPIYNATVVAYPSSNSNGPSGALGGLASRLGLSSGGGLTDPFDLSTPVPETIALMQSRQIAFRLFKQENMLPELFYQRWNPERKIWKPPSVMQQFISYLTGKPPRTEPTEDDAFETFNRIRTVSRDEVTGVISIDVRWRDPRLAAAWANALVALTDQSLRQEAIRQSAEDMKYLEKQAASASLSDLRDSIFTVAQKQITRGMLANVEPNFAIEVIDPARPPLRASWPNLPFLLAMALVAGLFFGSVGAIAWAQFLELRRLAGLPEWQSGFVSRFKQRIFRRSRDLPVRAKHSRSA